jgi:hypothetical protein
MLRKRLREVNPNQHLGPPVIQGALKSICPVSLPIILLMQYA